MSEPFLAGPGNCIIAVIQLIDSARGSTLQEWRFRNQPVITIGRGEDRDVAIADPSVSRLHAELRNDGNAWRLAALGRNGVFVNGRALQDETLSNGVVIRLGSGGPSLRFHDAPPANRNLSTLQNFDPETLLVLQLDENQLQTEVGEIASGDYFQQLAERARELRQRRL